MTPLVDSHCHLDHRKFDNDRDAVIQRALSAGVGILVAIGTGEGPHDLDAGLRLARQHEFVYATAGVHPHDAAKADEAAWAKLAGIAREPKVVGIGEIGLDYHYNFAPPDVQQAVFRRQLRLAMDVALPIVIHTREAWSDTVRILREELGPGGHPAGGIFHCFSGGPAEAAEALELGFHLSFSGIVTFPRASEIQEAARMAPIERLLVETDAPYLAPASRRGQRNEPAFVAETAARLAELKNVDFDTIAGITTDNWRSLCLRRVSGNG